MTMSPIVDHARTRQPQPVSDLCRANQIVDVVGRSHADDRSAQPLADDRSLLLGCERSCAPQVMRSSRRTSLIPGAALVEDTPMADDETRDDLRLPEPEPTVEANFAERWRQLQPDVQALVVMAIDAIRAGEFDPARTWSRFVDATIELLPLLSDGTLTLDNLRELALEHSRTPKRDAGP